MRPAIWVCFSAMIAVLPLTAAPIFSWSFDQPTGVVSPSDVVPMAATITSGRTSSTPIFFLEAILSPGSFPPSYDFAFDLSGLTGSLEPGVPFSFTFGSFTPDPAPVPPGTHSIVSADLQLCSDALLTDCSDIVDSSSGFERTVSAVPEPASLALLAAGLVAFGWFHKRCILNRTNSPLL